MTTPVSRSQRASVPTDLALAESPCRYDVLVEQSIAQVGLTPILERTRGDFDIRIALCDGLVETSHPCLLGAAIEQCPNSLFVPGEAGRSHATFIASMLAGAGPYALGLCCQCTLISIPIVDDAFAQGALDAGAAARRLSLAVGEAIERHATVIQLSVSFDPERTSEFAVLRSVLAEAARRGIYTFVAAGNDGKLGSSAILNAPGVIPVAMADSDGLPSVKSSLGHGLGSRGLRAPGVSLPGAALPSGYRTGTGSSYAVSFATAAYALLRGIASSASPDLVARALLAGTDPPLRSIVPQPLNAYASFRFLQQQGRIT